MINNYLFCVGDFGGGVCVGFGVGIGLGGGGG